MSQPGIRGRARRIHPNSLGAFATVDLGARQREVLDAIADLYGEGWHRCDSDLAAWLGWAINRITGRRGELVEAGLVVEGGNKIAETGRRVAWWRPAAVQLDLPGIPPP